MTLELEEKLQKLIDQQEIEHILKLYCRAIDRLDIDLLKSLYHPEATDDHGAFSGNAQEFADYIIPSLRDNVIDGMHSVTHCTIEVEGDFATSESYYSAYQLCKGGHEQVTAFFGESYAAAVQAAGDIKGDHDYFCAGRYIDLFERREGEWKILRRKITNEWNVVQPSNRITNEGYMQAFNLPGSRDFNDPVYQNSLPK